MVFLTAVPSVMGTVLRAIRGERALDVTYYSISRPKPLRRMVEAYGLAQDGFL